MLKFCPTLFNPITSLVIKHEFLCETLIGKWMQKSPNGCKKAHDPTDRQHDNYYYGLVLSGRLVTFYDALTTTVQHGHITIYS